MQQLNLKPTHKLVKNYYEVLGQFGQLNIDHEGAVRDAFQDLLKGCGRQFGWTLVSEYQFQRKKLHPLRIDGALLDTFRLARGYWEAKDEHDDLEKEIRAKLEKGYPRNNIIFQAPERAVLIQNGVRRGLKEDIRDSANLVELLKEFFGYREPHYEEWDEAVAEFKDRIPEIAKAVAEKIEGQRQKNREFVARFDAFYELCRQSINPNLSVQAVEEMLVQHLLTERIFRKIFANPEFTRRNVIAVEIEKVIDSMTAKQFSRDAFLKDLDRFYRAIESAAENTETYKQKQDFINTVYERFFQGYSPKEADTHGIVYTPQPIVDFMVRSVEDILQKEFGRSLSDKGVHILDPFVGTGNFITRVMKEIKTSALPYKYENELHCNEVMLLPYYVASMNIEHEYMERNGEYKAFPGICLVDTFDMRAQSAMFAEENTARIARQRLQPIFVVIGNPPYNIGQVNENDNNKNRKYPELDRRISETYAKTSKATNKTALSDPYVKALRWASDRIEDDGMVAFVTNSGFLDALAADGMRKTLTGEFDEIYIMDLGGNVRKNPKLSGTTHNVFGIQVGVSVNLLVRHKGERQKRECKIYYARAEEFWLKEQKYRYLDSQNLAAVPWVSLIPTVAGDWLTSDRRTDYPGFIPIGLADVKASKGDIGALFSTYSRGAETTRDSWTYNFALDALRTNVTRFLDTYNREVDRWSRSGLDEKHVDAFLLPDETKIKWCSKLKQSVLAVTHGEFNPSAVRVAVYRPFTKELIYFDPLLTHRRGSLPAAFPDGEPTAFNQLIWVKVGADWPMFALAVNNIPDLLPQSGSQCFPFYTYDEDGSNRRENITDWALNEFRTHYNDPNISKWDIFHYVYAVLHHPEYRESYAANLKRELPRIPFVGVAGSFGEGAGLQAGRKDALNVPSTLPKASAQTKAERRTEKAGPSAPPEAGSARDDNSKGNADSGRDDNLVDSSGDERHFERLSSEQKERVLSEVKRLQDAGDMRYLSKADLYVFRALAEAGRRLADLHINYEQQPEYPLERVEKGQLNWRVEKMRLGKDKTSLVYNDFLTLKGIPLETYEYRLGNRSALEWVIDQYQVSTDKRSGIVNDPNRVDDAEYIVRLVGQVITVSLETMKIVRGMPALAICVDSRAAAG